MKTPSLMIALLAALSATLVALVSCVEDGSASALKDEHMQVRPTPPKPEPIPRPEPRPVEPRPGPTNTGDPGPPMPAPH